MNYTLEDKHRGLYHFKTNIWPGLNYSIKIKTNYTDKSFRIY